MGLSKAFNAISIWALTLYAWFLSSREVLAASETLNLDIEAVDPVATPPPSMFSLLAKLLISLIIVGGLAYLTIKFLKKNAQITSASENISILDQYSMGMNKGLFIVEIAEKVLVLGVTDHNINVLYEISDRDQIERLQEKAAERETQPIIPPKIWDIFNNKSNSFRKPGADFSSHIQEQIKKLQVTAERSAEPIGKNEGNEQDGR